METMMQEIGTSEKADPTISAILEETKSMVRMMARHIERQERLIKEIARGRDSIELGQHKEKGEIAFSQKDDTETEVIEEMSDPEIRIRRLKLYQAALKGDWKDAKHIFDEYPGYTRVSISRRGDTALHIAAAANNIEFVKELIQTMNEEGVAQRNNIGNTALSFAAATGNVKLAKLIIGKNRDIAKIPDDYGILPVEMAASLGHKEMVYFLYQETKYALDEVGRIELFITLINIDMYDVALKLVVEFPELALARAGNNETALHALARKDLLSPNRRPAGFFKRWFDLVADAKDAKIKKLQAFQLVECLWKQVIRLSDSKLSLLIAKPWWLIFVAAKQGNVEFLSILVREYPDLIWKVDEDGHSIFHVAVLNRQEHIFKLIYDIASIKYLIVSSTDKQGNNILHLAGMLAPPGRLNTVPGAALQLQRELLWFEEVSKVVQSTDSQTKNKQGFTPKALFAEQHEELREKGETWLKDTAATCMLVATLIAIVAFAAAFAVPGGYKGDAGVPYFHKKVLFKIFAISDAVSLAYSCMSILDFISIFTLWRPQNDFLRSPTRRLKNGLFRLFISIAAMVVMFSTTFFILFKEGSLWTAILVTAIATMPILLFIEQEYWQLYHDLVLSTYASDSLFQKGKSHLRIFYDVLRSIYASDSLFQKGKSRLFDKSWEASEHQKAKEVV